MIIEREILPKLKTYLKKKEILALIGSRQVGKTTLMKELYKDIKENAIFITFEDIKILKEFEDNIDLFIEKYINNYNYIFIDEFQYSKNGGQRLKFIYDTIENKKIIISGSSNPELAIQSLQFLVGRVTIFEIFPLNFKEFLNYKINNSKLYFNKINSNIKLSAIISLFEEFLTYGGYPKVVLEKKNDEKIEINKQLVNSYILKEIKDVLEYKNIFEYEQLLQRLSIQDGGILNINSISQDLGIYNNKIKEMISILEKTYIINVIRPFYFNKVKEQIKSPKTYFQDIGYKNALLNNFNSINLRNDKGEIYENFICNELIKKRYKVQYWNMKNRNEVDFVLFMNGEVTGIEVKSKLNNDSITPSIKQFIQKEKPKKIYIFNENVESKYEYESVEIIFTHYINVFFV